MALRRRVTRRPDRVTPVLAVAALGTFATVVATEVGRVWRRGSAPLPAETDDVLSAVEEAVTETVEVAREGYRDLGEGQTALFNMLTSLTVTFGLARLVTWGLKRRGTVGPFRDLVVGRRHIHHYVPGILLAFGAGTAAIVTRNERLEPGLAVVFGAGMGLTLDESALLLELDDVYWSPEGRLSVRIGLITVAGLASLALGLRFLRRGEQIVLEQG